MHSDLVVNFMLVSFTLVSGRHLGVCDSYSSGTHKSCLLTCHYMASVARISRGSQLSLDPPGGDAGRFSHHLIHQMAMLDVMMRQCHHNLQSICKKTNHLSHTPSKTSFIHISSKHTRETLPRSPTAVHGYWADSGHQYLAVAWWLADTVCRQNIVF